MGPRHKDRGEPQARADMRRLSTGFNGATAQRPWRTTVGRSRVQLSVPASMGPRHKDRGERQVRRQGCCARKCFNGATAQRPWRTPLASLRQIASSARASMGPRHKDRGEQFQPALQQAMNQVLQWGHGTKTVENRSRCKRLISRRLERAVRAAGILEDNTEQSSALGHSLTPVASRRSATRAG